MKSTLLLIAILITGTLAAQTPEKTAEKADSLAKPIEQLEIAMKDGKVAASVRTLNPDSSYSDTIRIKFKKVDVLIITRDSTDWSQSENSAKSKSYELTYWNGIDIGVNGILGETRDFNLSSDVEFLEPEYGKSRYIAFNFAQVKGRIIKDYVGFATGLSFQIYNYKFNGDNEFVFQGDSLFSVPTGDKNVTKNKLRATYIAVPALLEFNTSLDQDRSFHISAGVVGKIRIENMYKQKFEIDGDDHKTSIKGELGLNRFAADAVVRVGYKKLTFFTQIGLLPIFDNDTTDDVYSFAAGLFIKV